MQSPVAPPVDLEGFYRVGMKTNLFALTIVVGGLTLQAAAQTPPPPTTPAKQPTKQVENPADKQPLPSREAAFMTEATVIATGLKFAEGPLLVAATKDAGPMLLICDLGGNALMKVTQLAEAASPEKAQELLSPSGSAAGSTLDAKGRLLLARFNGSIARSTKPLAELAKDEAIVLEDLVSNATPLNAAEKSEPMKLGRCNDIVVTPWGDAYFTDFGGRANKDDKNAKASKGLFRLTSKDSTHAATCVDDAFKAANGIAYDAKTNTLYVADYGATLVYAYDLSPDSPVPSNRRVFADLSTMKHAGGGMVDGMKVDSSTGNLLTTGPGGIWCIKPNGKNAGTFVALLPVKAASNIAIGTGREIFITAGDQVLRAELNAAPAN